MGKHTPTPPTPVDPVAAANAQSAANIASATAQQKLNMINTSSPYGQVSYAADPSAPGGYSQTTTLSPAEQALYNQSTAAQNAALGVANTQIGRVSDALGQTVTPGQLTSNVAGGPIANGYQQAPALQTGFAPGQIQNGVATGNPLQSSVANPQAQSGFNTGQAVQGDFGPQNYDDSVRAAQDAAYGAATSRLDPQYALLQRQQETQLANQGLNPNSDAWQNAMDQFGRTRTDAYQQANFGSIAAGQAAQQQAFGQSQAQGQFHNQAAGQQYQQGLGAVQQQNSAAGQNFGQNLQAGEFGNNANLAEFQRALQAGTFTNSAQAQAYAQSLGLMQAGNQASNDQQQRYADQAAFQNASQAQQFAQGQQNAQLGNQAQGTQFQQGWYGQQAPLNEFSALLSSGQVQAPQGVQYSPSSVGQTDVLGAYGLNQAQQQANYQAQMQQQASSMGGLFGLGSAALSAAFMSDERLKHDIRRIGTRPDGLGVYLFKYLWSPVERVGVMAQEVLKMKPSAVFNVGPWLAVNYGEL